MWTAACCTFCSHDTGKSGVAYRPHLLLPPHPTFCLPHCRLNGGQMHDGAIFKPAPTTLAGSDCGWIPAGGASSLTSQLKGKVAVVTLNRLPSEAIPAPCSYHRLAVAATQAEAAALVLGELPR